jgi:hypothetical protein
MVPISGRMGNGQAQVANPPLEHTPDVRRPAAQRLRSTPNLSQSIRVFIGPVNSFSRSHSGSVTVKRDGFNMLTTRHKKLESNPLFTRTDFEDEP